MIGKKSIIIITLVIIIVIYIVILESHDEKSSPNHEFIIEYSYQNPSEREVINVSENLDYKNIFNSTRYESWDYPNFIDKMVINDYIKIYENTNDDYDKWYKYEVNATQIINSTLNLVVEFEALECYFWDSNRGEEVCVLKYIPKYKIQIIGYPNMINKYNDERQEEFDPLITINSNGSYIILNSNQSFTSNNFNGFIIEMSLNYGYYGGPEHGLNFVIRQIVILNTNYIPTFIIRTERYSAIS